MITITVLKAARMIAKGARKPVLYVSSWPEDYSWDEVVRAVPCLDHNIDDGLIAFSDGHAIIICDNEDEQAALFDEITGAYRVMINRSGQIAYEA